MAQEKELMIEDVLYSLPDYIGADPFGDHDRGQNQIIKLADFIRKYFPDVDAQKLEQIFERAAAGMLRDGTGGAVSVNTFGKKIGIELLSRVLGAYKVEQSRRVERKSSFDEIPSKTAEDHYMELVEYVREHRELPALRFWKTIHRFLARMGDVSPIAEPAPKPTRGRAAQTLGEALEEKSASDEKYKEALREYFIKKGQL